MLEAEFGYSWPQLVKYDMCSCGFVYRCEHASAQSCPATSPGTGRPHVCGAPRQQARALTYSPIAQFCERVYGDPERAKEFSSWLERQSADPNIMLDICDGEAVRKALADDQRFSEDPRNLICVLVTDPFIVPGDERERSSTPWVLLVVNAPADKRHELGYCSVLTLMGGNVKPPGGEPAPMDHNHVLAIIKDELASLEAFGVEVYDANAQDTFRCHVKVVGIVSDYRGLQKHVGIKVSPAIHGCFNKKAKTHTFFLLAGPFGAYAVVSASLPRGVCSALLALLNACSDLWDKVQDRRRLNALRERVVEAVCLVELHMSCNELDIKLHNLIHLVDAIRNLGPLFAHAMFRPESLWGKLGRWAHSKRYLESSMLYAAIDREVLLPLLRERAKVRRENPDARHGAGLHEPAAEDTIEPELTMWCEEAFFQSAHDLSWGRKLKAVDLTIEEVAYLNATYSRSDLEEAVGGSATVRGYKEFWIGGMKLCLGSWFLCRPDENGSDKLWFGRVNGLYRHVGGDDVTRQLVRAEWFHSYQEEHGTGRQARGLAPALPAAPADTFLLRGRAAPRAACVSYSTERMDGRALLNAPGGCVALWV
ncbi:hypothetical protein PLESTF_000966400 [Pleodorina starrii]|nr:hypothetical protein PLESTF_000966400 [Pleodorina starrii]